MWYKDAENLCKFLGSMYLIRGINDECRIYRKITNALEIEIMQSIRNKTWFVYLWQIFPDMALITIYSGIRSKEDLADTLGYLAFKYQNLHERIRVDRENPMQ